MDLNEAKQLLSKNGYKLIKEDSNIEYTLYDKQLEYDEDSDPYKVVFGPASLEEMKEFVNKYTTKNFDEIPLDPSINDEPEEGFIIISR